MKSFSLFFIFLVTLVYVKANALTCSYFGNTTDSLIEFASQKDETCFDKMKKQVHTELEAALTYLAMGSHFSRDTVNRPGFAKFFFESGSEERQHAIKLLEYLLMRGDTFNKIIKNIKPKATSWTDGAHALDQALQLELSVTAKIRSIIASCEPEGIGKFNDYHLVDYLTGEFLTEQYQGQRDLAGKLSTLQKMKVNHNALGEFLFDKKLLKGEV